jgi:hypothetical protein
MLKWSRLVIKYLVRFLNGKNKMAANHLKTDKKTSGLFLFENRIVRISDVDCIAHCGFRAK